MVGASKQSFAQMYDSHVDEVYQYVHRRCQDHSLAEDITQDTFLTAIRSTSDPSSLTIAWLMTVAKNKLVDIIRRQIAYDKKLQLVANAHVGADGFDIAERLRVEAALQLLPVHYRLVLTLHYVNGMTVRAIADELDQSRKSVEGLITRARREIAQLLALDEQQQTAIGGEHG